MLKRFLFIAGLAMGTVVMYAASEGRGEEALNPKSPGLNVLTFRDAYHKILAYYPYLKSQKSKVEQAVAAKFEAYTALLPKVEGISSVTTGDDPVYVFGSLLRQKKFSNSNFALSSLNSPRHRTNFNFTLQGEMPLFNAFQTFAGIRASRYLEKYEIGQENFAKMEAALLGIESYLKVLLAKEKLKWVEEVQAAVQSDLKQAEELKDKGMVLGADFYAAKMISAEIKQLNYETAADEKTAGILLNILMGEPVEPAYDLSGKIPQKLEEVKSLQTWLDDAVRLRPDLKAFEAKVSARRVEHFKEKMSALPKIGAFGAVTEDTHDFETGGGNYLMGFKGNVDVLDAGYWARRKKSKAAYEIAQKDYEAYRDKIAKDVSRAVNGFDAVAASVPISEEAFAAAQEAVKQTEVLYREGRKSIADLLEIRRAFLGVASRRSETLFQGQLAYANILFLTGQLDEAALEAIASSIDGVR